MSELFDGLTNGTGIEYPEMSIDEALDVLHWYRFVDAWFRIGLHAATRLLARRALFKAAEEIQMRYPFYGVVGAARFPFDVS